MKDLIFRLAPLDNSGSYVKYFLEHPDEFPFPINSRDQNGNTLEHYYSNNHEMKKYLFEHGLVPNPEQGQTIGALTANTQGVHATEITEQNHFVANEMVKSYGKDKDILLTAATSYNENIKNFSLTPLETKLLGLSDSGKRNTLDKVLTSNQALPDDTTFIKMVTDKTGKVLADKYLKSDSCYYSHENAYNKQGDNITIPKTIGLVKLLIDKQEFPIAEKKELLTTLIRKNPE
ncbi:MAG: hypothetical protein RCG15_04975 [Candidatus Rickettsia vulgarisii]